jgi:hypothetical protein
VGGRVTGVVSAVLVAVVLAACGGGGSKSASSTASTSAPQTSTTTGPSSTGSTATTSGSGTATYDARGCSAPSAGQIGTAFGAAITKTVPTADNGCLWEAGDIKRSVQVSYHPASEFNPTRLAILKAGSKAASVPGANDAFVKHISLPNDATNDVEYVVFDNGTVQIAFGGPSTFLTDKNEEAVTTAIVG